jgi:hypothetical protein
VATAAEEATAEVTEELETKVGGVELAVRAGKEAGVEATEVPEEMENPASDDSARIALQTT